MPLPAKYPASWAAKNDSTSAFARSSSIVRFHPAGIGTLSGVPFNGRLLRLSYSGFGSNAVVMSIDKVPIAVWTDSDTSRPTLTPLIAMSLPPYEQKRRPRSPGAAHETTGSGAKDATRLV